MIERQQMIDRLVGVKSSKRNYYTALKNSVSELQKKNTQLEIINEVMKSFNVEMSMDEMLKNILEKLQKIFIFKHLSLFQFNRDSEKLLIMNVYPKVSTFMHIGKHIPIEGSLYWEVIESNAFRNYVVNENDNYIEHTSFAYLELKQILIFPLFAKGEIIGLFSLGSEEISNYDQTDISFLQQLSDQLAVSMENVRLYKEVLNGKNEWEQTFSAVMDTILLLDANGHIIRFNHAGEEMFQLNELKRNRHFSIEHLLYGKTGVQNTFINRCIETKQPTYEELKWKDQYYYEVYAYPVVKENDEVFQIIVYMKDVTKKRHYEVQIMQSGKLAALGEMAAGVAHELNNPLTAILGNAQLLLRKESEINSTYELLHDIFECGKRCQNIIRNLLTFSRQDEYLFELCSVNVAVERVLSLIGYQITQQHIKLNVNLDEEIHHIDGSIQQIEQVIINFLLNAKDALLEKDDNSKEIIIETKQCDQWIYLSVKDNGIGIDKEELRSIFHPFFTTKKEIRGTGLGLSVSLGIAEAHQGEIIVDSKVGTGSTFTLKIPKVHTNHQ